MVVAPATKEAQRAELHKTIWRIANDLRGAVDGWDFKSYVLGMLFYRFISENLTAYLNEQERAAGQADFDYAALGDPGAEFGRDETVKEKGFYILPSELFVNVRERAAKDENLNETLQKVFKNIEGSAVGTDSEDDLKGLFDDLDVNSAKLGNTVAKRNEKLVKLLDAIGELDLGDFNDHAIDSFGDAYEYLMTMYASSAGKSGGEFFTPQEVSELLARITVFGKKSVNKVYDPACGSGSLLLKFAKVLGKDKVRQGFFGQEINLTTYNLARINMFLHDINFEKFDIVHGDTLTDPLHWDDEPFEAIVSNPPYSIRWAGDSNPLLINDPRFAPAGVLAPKTKADLAFTMHMLSWLATNGTAAIVQFPGALYRAGSEQKIRKYLIDNNFVDTIIQLPNDLFFGTTITTCILVLKKSKKDNSVLFIDASNEFKRFGNKNKLLPEHQQKILDAFAGRMDVDQFAKLASNADVAANAYKLTVSSYVVNESTSEVIDIAALNTKISTIVQRQQELRAEIDAIVDDFDGGTDIDVRWSTLGDVCTRVSTGATPLKSQSEYYKDGEIPWLRTQEVVWRDIYDTEIKITERALRETSAKWISENCVIVAISGASAARAAVNKISLTTNQHCCNLEIDPKIANYRYVFQWVTANYEKLRALGQGARSDLNVGIIKAFPIALPSLDEQERIAQLLDKFDTLVNDTEVGIPAELKARVTQYEHYRDDLLTFKELAM